MLNRHLDEIIREGRDSGRVIGVKASYTPRFSPKTGKRLESYASNGNIDETKQVIYVRARRAVIVGTGGYMGNVPFRTMFDPRMSEPSMQFSTGLMGLSTRTRAAPGRHEGGRASSVFQANLHATRPAPSDGSGLHRHLRQGDAGAPRSSSSVPTASRSHHRLESSLPSTRSASASTTRCRPAPARCGGPIPPGSSGTKKPFTPLDWRNASVGQVRSSFAWGSGSDAALAMNEGSRAPDYSSGPVWAIFDQAAVDANGWKLRHPYIADPPNGTFFKADTIAELGRLVVGNRFMRMPLKYLEQTVARFNGFVAAGKDTDFEKAAMKQDRQGAFYAALIPFAVNDFIGGLKNRRACARSSTSIGSRSGLFAAARPPAAAGRMASAARVSMAYAGTYAAAGPAG